MAETQIPGFVCSFITAELPVTWFTLRTSRLPFQPEKSPSVATRPVLSTWADGWRTLHTEATCLYFWKFSRKNPVPATCL